MANRKPKPPGIREIEDQLNISLKKSSRILTEFSQVNSNEYVLDETGKNVVGLNLSNNLLDKVPELQSIPNLLKLDLGSNRISRIDGLNKLRKLEHLDFSDNNIGKIENLEKLVNLTFLSLSSNRLTQIEGLDALKKLKSLVLWNNQITEISGLDNLRGLIYLELSSNSITQITGLSRLKVLDTLWLSSNYISELENLSHLSNLRTLSISHNMIKDMKVIRKLTSLRMLFMSNNVITQICDLEKLTNLRHLDLSRNQISDINNLEPIIEQLEVLNLALNDIRNVSVSDLNNIKAIKGYFKSFGDGELVDNKHIKLNIIGSGGVGKTQLFNLITGKPYQPKHKETHGANVEIYKFGRNEEYTASLWDFGGQSYFHGTHTIFLRQYDFNLVLYRTDQDSHNYSYWLGAARNFSYKLKKGNYVAPLFLVQNVWSSNKNEIATNVDSIKLNTYAVSADSIFNIDLEQFHIHPKNNAVRKRFFLQLLDEKMRSYALSFNRVPKQFIEIREKVFADHKNLNEKDGTLDLPYWTYDEFLKSYASNVDDQQIAYLLEYLEFTGVILHFWEKTELSDIVFPNPKALTDWIYNVVLDQAFKNNSDGVLSLRMLKSKLPNEDQRKIFLKLMQQFDLIFKRRGTSAYVIPQFLPENKSSFKNELLKQIPFTFSIRFEDYMHEGRMFNFLSNYGEFAIDETAYWKYGLLFKKYELTGIVFFDPVKRLVSVHIENKPNSFGLALELFRFFTLKKIPDTVRSVDNPEEHIFNSEENQIKHTVARESEFSSEDYIVGAQIATNGVNFFDVRDTIESNDKSEHKVAKCVVKKNWITLDILTQKLLGMDTSKLKNVFISYSRKDTKFKDGLVSHLSLLKRYGTISDWNCDQMKPGKWHDQIQSELQKADIIIYMISANFMSSDYIMHDEVKKGLELVAQSPNKKVICVLVRDCYWKDWKELEDFSLNEADAGHSMDLSQYQFLPYYRPVNDKGEAVNGYILALDNWGRGKYPPVDSAYAQIVEAIYKSTK